MGKSQAKQGKGGPVGRQAEDGTTVMKAGVSECLVSHLPSGFFLWSGTGIGLWAQALLCPQLLA